MIRIITNDFRWLLSAFLIMLLPLGLKSQNFSGAWKLMSQNGKPFAAECIKIYNDGYFMFAIHQNGSFVNAGGGTYEAKENEYVEVPDFYASDSTFVRKPIAYAFSVNDDELTLTKVAGNVKEKWKKIDDATTALNGVWRFGARVNDEGVAGPRRGGDSPRQTVKILSGKYFQWAAFNYKTRQLSGTGGGIYKLEDNQYTETIRFFSRDNARVGISLTFDCRLIGDDWYHKGKGTTGNPLSEVWEKIK